MAESEKNSKNSGFSLDWLVGGVLTKIGDTFDRITGRGWNPSSSLATSRLVEKIQFLLDQEAREEGGGKFAPHILTLKMQWNKFADGSDDELEKLRTELHAATIDHINDKLYHTFGPIEIDIKKDYFTDGVRLIGSFGEFGEEEDEAAVNVTLPNITIDHLPDGTRASINLYEDEIPFEVKPSYTVTYALNGKHFSKEIDQSDGGRYSVGRVKENEIALDDPSVSKVHASLVFNSAGDLVVADTGSTNGTYIDGKRIAYGKAVPVPDVAKMKFGSVEVELKKNELPEPVTDVMDVAVTPAAETVAVPVESAAKRPVSEQIEQAQGNVPDSEPMSTIETPKTATNESGDWGSFENDPGSSPEIESEAEPKSREDWEI
ncbi:MAG: FHA domain-containing protein [Pyrinomonadaceae bacterium]|nr:FHA domain-containing protein [Pyrinomonadaceae bacterium]